MMLRKIVRASLITFALAGASSAVAATVVLTHPYGELITRGEIKAQIDPVARRLPCEPAARVQRVGRIVSIDANLLAAGAPAPACPGPAGPRSIAIGELSEAGWWSVVLRLYEPDGITLVDGATLDVRVTKANATCNRYPFPGSMVNVIHRQLQPHELIDRLETDPRYVQRLGSPQGWRAYVFSSLNYRYLMLFYPPLSNPHEKRAELEATGEFETVWVEGQACFATPPPDAMGTVIEFHHAELDHYFYSSNPEEVRGLDDGTGAKGWTRTGKAFAVISMPGCMPAAPQQNAYRFYGRPGTGLDTHVITVDREECRSLDDSGMWQFEGAPFWATAPDARGECSLPGEVPLYRLWRSFGTSNHRFTTERGVVDTMVAKGWKNEGVAMCVRGGAAPAQRAPLGIETWTSPPSQSRVAP